MNFKKFTLISILVLCHFAYAMSQGVPQKILVEHFTNSRCSICASRNPGFYKALDTKPSILHIAYHPSSPYANCLFSQQNKSENDERTKFYGLYGATPTFMVNGVEKFSGELQSANTYASFENKTSPFSIKVDITQKDSDSIFVKVVVKVEAEHSIEQAYLSVQLVEDTVFYNAPNNENLHFDVHRKSFTGDRPVLMNLPKAIGQTYEFNSTIKIKDIWDLDRLYALAILQKALPVSGNYEMLQVENSTLLGQDIISTTYENEILSKDFVLYPNPVNDKLYLKKTSQKVFFENGIIIDGSGKVVMHLKNKIVDEIDVSSLSPGLYFLGFNDSGKRVFERFVRL